MDINVVAIIVFMVLAIIGTVVAMLCSANGYDGLVSGMASCLSTVCYIGAMFGFAFNFEDSTNLMIAFAFAGIALMKVNGYYTRKCLSKTEDDAYIELGSMLHQSLTWFRTHLPQLNELFSNTNNNCSEDNANTVSNCPEADANTTS